MRPPLILSAAATARAAEERREEVGERIAVAEHLLHLFLRHRTEAARSAHVDVPGPPTTGEPRPTSREPSPTTLFVILPVRAELVVLLPLGGRSEEHTSELQSPCNLV